MKSKKGQKSAVLPLSAKAINHGDGFFSIFFQSIILLEIQVTCFNRALCERQDTMLMRNRWAAVAAATQVQPQDPSASLAAAFSLGACTSQPFSFSTLAEGKKECL